MRLPRFAARSVAVAILLASPVGCARNDTDRTSIGDQQVLATTTSSALATTSSAPIDDDAVDAITKAIAVVREWETAQQGPVLSTGPVAQVATESLGDLSRQVETASGLPSAVRVEASRAIARLGAKIYSDFECIRVDAGYQDDPTACNVGASFGPLRTLLGEIIDLLAQYSGLTVVEWEQLI